MKFVYLAGSILIASQQAAGFQTLPLRMAPTTRLGMFSGAGAGAPKEDNPEEAAQIKLAAANMGMSVEEYTTAMNARVKLAELMDNTIVTGKTDFVQVEQDVNAPPKKFEIIITEEGKALSKEALSKELSAALRKASNDARAGRAQAQRKMMEYISEQMKKMA